MARKKMDPTWKEKWLTALRSGDYEQGSSALRPTAGSYCCLGVVFDLMVKDGIVSWEDPQTPQTPSLPMLDADLLRPEDAEVLSITKKTQQALANLNDEEGADFNEIAGWIEAKL